MKFVGKVVAAVLIGLVVIVILIAGCAALVANSDEGKALTDEAGVIAVQAPAGKCWSGAIGNSTKEGCGPKEFTIEGESIIVGNAQKQTEGRWKLTLTLTVGGEEKDRSQTDAEFGIAQVSE